MYANQAVNNCSLIVGCTAADCFSSVLSLSPFFFSFPTSPCRQGFMPKLELLSLLPNQLVFSVRDPYG